jgi:hydrogenase maturation protease
VKKVVIGGVGNVLLGDDGVGPYVVHVLEHRYEFPEAVSICDLGTPGLDLVGHLSGIDALILIDAISNDTPAGTLSLYRREDILRNGPAPVRMDPHSPSLSESLLIAEFTGEGPRDVLLIGISAQQFEPGAPLSEAVRRAAIHAVEEVLLELDRLDIEYQRRSPANASPAWWEPVSDPMLV